MSEAAFRVLDSRLSVDSHQGPHFVDLTDVIESQLDQTGLREGSLLVFSKHTTAGVVIQENEPLLLLDMQKKLESLAPPHEKYLHDDYSQRTENLGDPSEVNGHSHCQSLFVGQGVQIPIHQFRLQLGRWQRIFLLEMDRPRRREVQLQWIGIP